MWHGAAVAILGTAIIGFVVGLCVEKFGLDFHLVQVLISMTPAFICLFAFGAAFPHISRGLLTRVNSTDTSIFEDEYDV